MRTSCFHSCVSANLNLVFEVRAVLMFSTSSQTEVQSPPSTRFWQVFRRRLFQISLEETTFARRGFRANTPEIQQRLEQVGRTFLQGYHAAIEDDRFFQLVPKLNAVENEWRGFAFEGAAMGLALLDALMPWRRDRVSTFLSQDGAAHAYMVHVGAGWILARLPGGVTQYLKRLQKNSNLKIRHISYAEGYTNLPDPLLGWLALDGYGFHQGYFHWPIYVAGQAVPKCLSGYACRVFDQGLGRSLWFLEGADVDQVVAAIWDFPASRQADLWSGIGLACAYAGGVDEVAIATLQTAAAAYHPQLAQGAAFAAKARQRAGNPAPHTEQACQILCDLSASDAADLTDRALNAVLHSSSSPAPALSAYELWRQHLQTQFSNLPSP